MSPLRHRHWIPSCLMAAVMLAGAAPARAEIMPSAHVSLKSSRAQANREQIFRHLMTGATPTWMQGKSQRQIDAWSGKMKAAILRNGRQLVKQIVADPAAAPTDREKKILGLLSPVQRATLLREEAGFKVQNVTFKVDGVPTDKLKVVLRKLGFGTTDRWGYTSYGTPTPEFKQQMSIFNRVMSPNLVTYAPAGGHSKYVSGGQMFDIWNGSQSFGELRPNKYPHFPTWLSDGEAVRMQQVAGLSTKWSSYGGGSHALGTKHSRGIAGMWPPTPGQRKSPSNSCTTVFIRAPVGERDPAFAWIDQLQSKVARAATAGRLSIDGVDLRQNKLLEAVSGKTKAEYQAIFEKVRQALPGEARGLSQLRGQVDFFHDQLKQTSSSSYPNNNDANSGDPRCAFPMDLMHRTPLARMANIKGDPLGPGMAKQKFRAADPTRVGVVVEFER